MEFSQPLTDGQASYLTAKTWLEMHPTFTAGYWSEQGHGKMCPPSGFTPSLYQNELCGVKFSREIQSTDTPSSLQEIVEFASVQPFELPGLLEPEDGKSPPQGFLFCNLILSSQYFLTNNGLQTSFEDWKIRGRFPSSTIKDGADGVVSIKEFDGSTIKWCIGESSLTCPKFNRPILFAIF